jgi:hypothetical protein
MSAERRPVHGLVAYAAVPAGVSAAAVPEAGDVTDEDLVRPEGVSVRVSGWRVNDPLPGYGLYQFAEHV